ncbi:hypothetical protein [Georgenia sp. SUBG003]|uniref:hypothetical protein n=1 Tax=Georgenia sp. SUBG003 TaxID=1497974 RepID=UPI003AB57484
MRKNWSVIARLLPPWRQRCRRGPPGRRRRPCRRRRPRRAGPPRRRAGAAPAATGTPGPRRISLDLCGRDYETCRRELADAVNSLWRGDTLSITSGPELLALRFELETHLPAGYRWSLPAGTADRSVTTVERL